MTEEQKAAVENIKKIMEETGFKILGGTDQFSASVSDLEEEDRPCGQESGPCCGGKCG